ncbi:cell wall hydrolase [Methylorubrum populi]|uniref:cell wall hydrolase n=1 Tax=Methylorubrum populi TaxID=223967 RepID=UPI00186AD7B1|nr:cell wall hydrolase [Methylorubrum populi]
MARTVYGEANGQSPRGQAAVVWAIRNRMATEGYPSDAAGVVLQRGQFEPWDSRRNELLNLPANSRAYREALQTVDDVFGGAVPDITNGATNFYAPVAQAQLGRRPPKWAQGEPLANEGGHLFYRPGHPTRRPPVIAPPEPGVPATLEEAGIMPRGPASPSTPKASPMPDLSDDDLFELYSTGKPAKASSATKTASAKPPSSADTSSAPADGLSDEALFDLYMAPGAGKTAAPATRTAEPAPASRAPAMPLQSPDGIVDGNTGALVVAGKPFTDNTSGLWSGFNNLANGALLGAGVPLAAGAAALKEKLTNGGDLGNLYAQARAAYGGAQERFQRENPGTALATELAGSIPTTIAATAAGGAALGAGGNALLDAVAGTRAAAPLAAAGNFLTGTAGGGSGAAALATRIASRSAAGAAAGGFGGAINTGLTGGDIGDNALSGAMVGGAIGAALPAAGAAASGTLNRLTGATSPELAQLARSAQDRGFPVRAAEISNSPLVRGADAALSKIPGMGYGGIDATKQAALNRGVAQVIGEDASRITPTVMQTARDRIGKVFDRVAKDSWVRLDNGLSGDLQDIMARAAEALPKDRLVQFQKLVRDGILPKFGTLQEMEGSAYQAITKKGSTLSLMQDSGDPTLAHFARQIRGALDDALERAAGPELAGELRQARTQYRALKVIEPLVDDTSGNIDAAALRSAVGKATDGMAYGRGGDLAELARIAGTFGPQKGGGAAPESSLRKFGAAAGAAGGLASAAVGLNNLAPSLAPYASAAALPAAGALAGGRVASQILRSPAVSNRLINQALGTGQAGPINRLAAIAGEGSYAPAAATYNRTTAPSGPSNNNSDAARLMEFLANRTRQPGVRVN